MQRVIVNVQRAGDPRTRELEVSVGLPGVRLAELIARALSWDREANGDRVIFEIEVLPLGRRLGPRETLRSVDAWDGSWLILHMVGTERWADMSEPDELVSVPEQVWSREPDLPTDIGVRRFTPLEPSVHISATPLHAPDEMPTRPDPPVTVRGESDTQPVPVFPPDTSPTTVVERLPPTSASEAVAPSSETAGPTTDPSAILPSEPAKEPAAPPAADTPLKGFRPWRSRRRPPPGSPS